MNKNIQCITISLCVIQLSSCVIYDDTPPTYTYQKTYLGSAQYQAYPPMEYYSLPDYSDEYRGTINRVVVPNSYHVGESHSPVSFKDRDRSWVASQNPQGYTIEVADGDKAALVAQKLYRTPKGDRMAQVQYQRNGKSYYKGVYGSYPNAEAAQKALDSLPPEVKQGAGVKSWGNVQSGLQ